MNNWHSGTLVQYLYRIRKPWDLHISTYPHLHFEISECLSKQHTQEFQSHKYDKSFQIKLTFRHPIGCCLHIYRIEYCYGGCYCSETTVKIRHGITEWFKICKRVWQGCMLLPCLFSFYTEYIMQDIRQDEPQAPIKFAMRNINNLIYAGSDGK